MKPVTTASFNATASVRSASFPSDPPLRNVHPFPARVLEAKVKHYEIPFATWIGTKAMHTASEEVSFNRWFIAEKYNVSVDTVSRWTKDLEETGILKRTHKPNKTTGKYQKMIVRIVPQNAGFLTFNHVANLPTSNTLLPLVEDEERNITSCTIINQNFGDDSGLKIGGFFGTKSEEVITEVEEWGHKQIRDLVMLPAVEKTIPTEAEAMEQMTASFPEMTTEQKQAWLPSILSGAVEIPEPHMVDYDPVKIVCQKLAEKSAHMRQASPRVEVPAPAPFAPTAPAPKPFSSEIATLISMGIDPKVKNKLCRDVLPKLTEEDFTMICQEAKFFRAKGQLKNAGGWLYSRLNTMANTQTSPIGFLTSYAQKTPSPEAMAKAEARYEQALADAKVRSEAKAKEQAEAEARHKAEWDAKQARRDAWDAMTFEERAERIMAKRPNRNVPRYKIVEVLKEIFELDGETLGVEPIFLNEIYQRF